LRGPPFPVGARHDEGGSVKAEDERNEEQQLFPRFRKAGQLVELSTSCISGIKLADASPIRF